MWAWKLFAIFHKTRYRFRFSFWFVHRWSDHTYSRRWKPIRIERCRQLFGWEIRRKQPSNLHLIHKINGMNRKKMMRFFWHLYGYWHWWAMVWCKKSGCTNNIDFYENEHLFWTYQSILEIIRATVDLHHPRNWSESN